MGIILSVGITAICLVLFRCNPIARGYELFIFKGTCMTISRLYTISISFDIVTDLLILALPIPIVVKVQIPRKQKIGLAAMFSFAIM